MKRFIVLYLSTLAILVPLDFLFLKTVMAKIFYSQVGDMLTDHAQLIPAALFYMLYPAGVVVLINNAYAGKAAAWRGAVLGFMCYASFELTNLSILKHWEWAVAAPDILWGTAMTAISAALGGWLAQKFLHKY